MGRRRKGNLLIVTREREVIPGRPCARMRWLMKRDFVVWDTETTGLEADSKIVSIGIVGRDGAVLVDRLFNPGVPIPRDATAIHGVTDDMAAGCESFADAYPLIREALHNKVWCIYNKGYDIPRLDYECDRYYLPRIEPYRTGYTDRYRNGFSNYERDHVTCAMDMFANHYGEWSEYFGDYKWQRLSTAASYYGIKTGRAHHAVGDALTTLKLVQKMAMDEDRNDEIR